MLAILPVSLNFRSHIAMLGYIIFLRGMYYTGIVNILIGVY